MKQRKNFAKQKVLQPKKPQTPQAFVVQMNNDYRKKTVVSKGDEKSVCEKYLNVYESINKKQTSEFQGKLHKTVSRIKKAILQPKIIFQNPIIRKSYTKIPSAEVLYKDENTSDNLKDTEMPNQEKVSINRNSVDRKSPSKKNQMALKLISENRRSLQKEKRPPQQQKFIIQGNQVNEKEHESISTNYHRTNKNSLHDSTIKNTQKNHQDCTSSQPYFTPFSLSQWQSNTFTGYSTSKTYKGYYKSKNKKKNDQKRQKGDKNSDMFIRKVDRQIDMELYRRMALRPGTVQGRLSSKKSREVDVAILAQKMNQSYEFDRQEKIVRMSSEVKLQNHSKDPSPSKGNTTNYFGLMRNPNRKASNEVSFLFNGKLKTNFERKNSKKYNFNNKTYVHARTYSSNIIGQTFEVSDPILGITTDTPLTASIFFASHQQTNQSDKENVYLESKNPITVKDSKPKTANSGIMHNSSPWSRPISCKNPYTRKERVTLNKIQDAIENDMQLRILRLEPSSTTVT